MKRECLEQKLTFQRKTYIMCPKYMYREGNKYQHIYMSAWFFKCAADIKNRHLYCHYMHKIWISSIDHGCLSSCSCPERRGTSSTVLYTWIHWAFTQTLRMQKGLNVWLLHLSQTAVFFTVWHLIPITDLWEEGGSSDTGCPANPAEPLKISVCAQMQQKVLVLCNTAEEKSEELPNSGQRLN